MDQEVTGPADAAATLPLSSTCGALPLSSTHEALPLSSTHEALSLSNTHDAPSLSNTHKSIPLSNNHDALSLFNTHNALSLSNTHNTLSLSNNHDALSLSNTHDALSLSNTHEAISLSNTHNPIPLSNTHNPIPLSNTYEAVSLSKNDNPIPLSNIHDAVSLSNTHSPIPLSNTHDAVSLSNTHSPIPLSNTHNPIPLSNNHDALSLSNTHNALSLSNAHNALSLSNTHKPIPLSNTHNPIPLSNTHNPIPLSNTHEAVSLSNTHNPIPLSNTHDVNCNETLHCFSVRLNRRTQATDNGNLNFHYPLGGSDEEEEEDHGMPGERWAPLGADLSRAPTPAEPSAGEVSDRLQILEEEQDQLNSSLLALTSHFAQVQFRLKQIVSAEPAQREVLLKELENFAFRGIPDVRKCQMQETPLLEEMRTKEHEDKMTAQKEKQRELITQLKSQLEDLETFAYESGHADEPPTSRVLEKQQVLLEEVRSKLHIDLQNFDRLSTEELREIVDNAVSSIVDPAKVKEKLIDQLKTQVVDLERFVQFLQGETDNPGPYGQQRCTCPGHPKTKSYDSDGTGCCGSTKARQGGGRGKGDKPGHKGIDTTTTLMRKALAVLQIYVFSQLGCGSQDLNQNIVKNTTTKGNHWGELREKLEVAVSRAVDLGLQQQERKPCIWELREKLEVAVSRAVDLGLQQQERDQQWTKDCSEGDLINSDAEEQELMSSPAVTVCVRKELATAIRDLIQHGLVEMNKNSGLVRIGCFSNRSADVAQRMHAWDLLVRFYDMKQGREYKESPARMLSQSFHLDTVGGRPITAKQTLLGAIDTVQNSNTPYPCGKDSYFKAFICHALNERKLVTWLRLLFRTQSLIDRHYLDWSYVAHTGFEDALLSLERLLVINFRLPVDVAVRSFSNIRDVF
ncbi:hypothetical protein ACOMHN_058555 [Nucella lapillus]